jgi:hypothetical protein
VKAMPIVLIVVGALLVAAPVLGSQWLLTRAVKFHEEHGEGATLPEELKARPFAAIEWACWGTGILLIGSGAWIGRKR